MATKDTAPKPALPAPATPENTPIPGGGSWRWAGTGWIENTPDATAPQPAPEPEE